MQLHEIISEINSLADESEPEIDVIAWINDAIARINIELNAKFPFMDIEELESEPAFPEVWQRACLIPFGVGRLKQMDSSQFEYIDAYGEFIENLSLMKTKYKVPEEYRDEDSQGSFRMDLSSDNYYAGGW